jgi:hypothetical protein
MPTESRQDPPSKGRWYLDRETGERVTFGGEDDLNTRMWWLRKDGTTFYCDSFDWYVWGRFK